MADYRVVMADGREIEVTGVRNRDAGARRFNEGARGHAIFFAREAGVVGEIARVEKLARNSKRHAEALAEGLKHRVLLQDNARRRKQR